MFISRGSFTYDFAIAEFQVDQLGVREYCLQRVQELAQVVGHLGPDPGALLLALFVSKCRRRVHP
jgi:hypothetical protein